MSKRKKPNLDGAMEWQCHFAVLQVSRSGQSWCFGYVCVRWLSFGHKKTCTREDFVFSLKYSFAGIKWVGGQSVRIVLQRIVMVIRGAGSTPGHITTTYMYMYPTIQLI